MRQAVTRDVKFTSLNPVYSFHFCVVCQKHLFVYNIELVVAQQ